jgi:hypothetical protein
MNSLSRIMEAIISIPYYTGISERSISIPMRVLSQAMDPGSLVIVNSTGLKVFGKDEWHQGVFVLFVLDPPVCHAFLF